jgi:hypothetical protein
LPGIERCLAIFPMPVFLKHVEGSKSEQLDSFDKDQIRIGRQDDNDLKFDPQKDVAVSRLPAEIYWTARSTF